MNLPKLDARGVAHHLLLALIVVGVAVGGTYWLVFSKANSVVFTNGRIAIDGTTSELDGSQQVFTATGGDAALSPDGKTYAYRDIEANKIGVTAVGEADSSKAKLIDIPSGMDFSTLSWSPDGNWLMVKYFSQQSPNYAGIWLVKPDGTGAKVGPTMGQNEGNSVAWMPDSNSVMYSKLQYTENTRWDDICTVNLDGSNRRCSSMEEGKKREIWHGDMAKVTADGTKVIFASPEGPITDSLRTINLYLVNLDGSGLTQITKYAATAQIQVNSFVLSPDGTMAIFNTTEEGNPFYSVALTDTRLKASESRLKNSRFAPPSNYLSIQYLKALSGASGSGRLTGWEGIGPSGVTPVTVGCSIESPASVMAGASYTGNVKVTNTSSATSVKPDLSPHTLKVANGTDSHPRSFNSTPLPQLNPGASTSSANFTTQFQAGTAVLSTSGTAKHYRGTVNFGCSKTVSITAQTSTVSCVVKGVPNKVKKGDSFKPSVTVTATGNQATWVNISGLVNPNKGGNSNIGSASISSLSPGSSQTKNLSKYSVAKNTKASSAVVKVTAAYAGGQATCQDSFNIK